MNKRKREDVIGKYGTARYIEFDRTDPKAAETVTSYLLDAPGFHPAWSQYLLFVVRLTDGLPGFPDPIHAFPGSTHELLIMALNPEESYTRNQVEEAFRKNKGLRYLEPQSLSLQFIATDEEMESLCEWAAIGITHHAMPPEKVLGYKAHKDMWLSSLTRTLAHIRNEPHASGEGMPIELNEP